MSTQRLQHVNAVCESTHFLANNNLILTSQCKLLNVTKKTTCKLANKQKIQYILTTEALINNMHCLIVRQCILGKRQIGTEHRNCLNAGLFESPKIYQLNKLTYFSCWFDLVYCNGRAVFRCTYVSIACSWNMLKLQTSFKKQKIE